MRCSLHVAFTVNTEHSYGGKFSHFQDINWSLKNCRGVITVSLQAMYSNLYEDFFFCRVEKNIYCRVKKRSLIRTLVIKKNDEKKGKIKRIFRAQCPKCFKKEMAWQSHKDKRKRKREKEQLVARTTLMITEKGFRLWIGFQVRAAYFISFYIWFFEKMIFKKITNYIFSIIKMLT